MNFVNKVIYLLGILAAIYAVSYSYKNVKNNPCRTSYAARRIGCREATTSALSLPGFGRGIDHCFSCQCKVRGQPVIFAPTERDITWVVDGWVWRWRDR